MASVTGPTPSLTWPGGVTGLEATMDEVPADAAGERRNWGQKDLT
jgi:hypothetical protein